LVDFHPVVFSLFTVTIDYSPVIPCPALGGPQLELSASRVSTSRASRLPPTATVLKPSRW